MIQKLRKRRLYYELNNLKFSRSSRVGIETCLPWGVTRLSFILYELGLRATPQSFLGPTKKAPHSDVVL